MLIQVAINNIESVEQGEEILKKWHYHLDEDQSHVVIEREESGVLIRISGFHPWADELGEDDGECCDGDDSCDCDGDGDDCCGEGHQHGEGDSCCCHHGEAEHNEDEEDDSDEDDEESEVIYLGQALFVPADEQARALATELMDNDYIGTVSVSAAGSELNDTDAFRALPDAAKDAVIADLEELGDAEAYLSMYEVMGLKD